MRTAADAKKRLQASPLYRRRQWDAANARVFAKARGHWYLSEKFTPRYSEAK